MTRFPDGRYVLLLLPDWQLRYVHPGGTVEALHPDGNVWTLTALEVGKAGRRDVYPDRLRAGLARWKGHLIDPANWPDLPRHFFAMFQTVRVTADE